MPKSKYFPYLQNFKDENVLSAIKKIVNDSKTKDVRYFSTSDFIEIACKKLIAEHKNK